MVKELLARPEQLESLKREAGGLPSWELTPRQMCDLELLMNGGFAPLAGFMCRADYEQVVREMRLVDGTLWPIPVTLDVTEAFGATLAPGARLVLREPEGAMLAVLKVADLWIPDRKAEAEQVFGTLDPAHPGVDVLLNQTHPMCLGGEITGIELPQHYDFIHLRRTPRELREHFRKSGWQRVVAFQTRNPLHRAHVELAVRAMRMTNAKLLIHPVVGLTRPGDVDHYTRVRCYEKVMAHFPEGAAALSLLPLSMRMAGPREALWHAIIRRNYGCTHFIVGRDHAGPGKNSLGRDFYGPYDAQQLAVRHEEELGIKIIPFHEMVYVDDRSEYAPANEVRTGERVLNISGTEFRRLLTQGLEIPPWFSYPEVTAELGRTYLPRTRQGITVFFTGLSGAGKSTIARALMSKLLEAGGRTVTLLDGDLVRKNLSSELGFSRAHRDINILRIGYVAAEITRHGGIAICAPIAPYSATRAAVRRAVSVEGGFILVHVSTPLEVCEARDRKGLYARARAGLVKEFTGISDPYETPADADIVIDTRDCTPLQAAGIVLTRLEVEGYLG